MPTLQPTYDINTSTTQSNEFRAGISLPFRTNSTGDLSTSSGELHDNAIIIAALLSEESENGFQQPNTKIEATLFEPDDPSSQAIVRRKLEEVFEDFQRQNRYRLIPSSIEFRATEDGAPVLYFKYHNLEADQYNELTVSPQN